MLAVDCNLFLQFAGNFRKFSHPKLNCSDEKIITSNTMNLGNKKKTGGKSVGSNVVYGEGLSYF
eukprot:snap_masked-scaffold_3-processed-gene-1.23-mRNA-1 protein AED:1.00 eAED:1.00 QI:0/0/0/0/1/1/2/0/63